MKAFINLTYFFASSKLPFTFPACQVAVGHRHPTAMIELSKDLKPFLCGSRAILGFDHGERARVHFQANAQYLFITELTGNRNCLLQYTAAGTISLVPWRSVPRLKHP